MSDRQTLSLAPAAPPQPRPLAAARSVLASKHMAVLAAALATTLSIPALSAGEALDDHFHRAQLDPDHAVPLTSSGHGIFGFVDDDPARTQVMRELGILPWWTGERLRAAFFRPLAELTHRADYLLFADAPRAMHAHSLLWAALLVLAVAAFYRRFLDTRWIAGLAALLYAVDDAHAMPVAWLANRNAILATLFGVLAMLAHDRWRRDRRARWAPVAILMLSMSLLSAEAGIATTAYLFAHALFIEERARGWRRFLPLLPYAVVVVAWRLCTTGLGYGAHGSALYVDPLHDPLRFGEALAMRAPVLLAGQWAPLPADVDNALLTTQRPFWVITAVLALTVLASVVGPRLPRDRTTRFFATGMLLSAVPIAATFPSDRLLFFVGIGAMGLLARVLPVLLADRARWPRYVGFALVFVHLVAAPVAFAVRARTPAMIREDLGPCTQLAGVEGVEEQHVVLVNGLDSCSAYAPILAGIAGRPAPQSMRVLAPGFTPVSITRETERAIVVERQGGWFTATFESIFWDPDVPFVPGDARHVEGMTSEVVEVTPDGRPLAVRFTFATGLEDPSLRFLHVDDDGAIRPMRLPRIGEPPITLAPVYP